MQATHAIYFHGFGVVDAVYNSGVIALPHGLPKHIEHLARLRVKKLHEGDAP